MKDDSNQAAEVTLPYSKYNIKTGKLIQDVNQNPNEPNAEITMRSVKEIADSLQPEIQTDHQSRNLDGKLPLKNHQRLKYNEIQRMRMYT